VRNTVSFVLATAKFALDFNVGNAVRFLLEKSDGDELTNLLHGDEDAVRLSKQTFILSEFLKDRVPDYQPPILQRKALVTVTYNTEHVVRFARYGARRATSTSTATKIAEVSAPNTTEQRELPIGDDRGFLWRLNAYWRYEDVTGGTIAECESVTLSRDVPALVRYVVDPLVDSTARESMVRTLLALRAHFASAGAIGR